MKKFESGVTLIVVLIILIAITVIGSLAIRSSILSLKVATVSQAQQLLLQNSDAALFNVENPATLDRAIAMNGMLGFLKRAENADKELVFCFKSGNAEFFNFHNASVIGLNGTSVQKENLGGSGFCELANGFFTSGRNTVLTQVAIKTSDESEMSAFQHMQAGTDPESSKKDPAQMYTVYATSIFPGLAKSDVSDAQMDACLNSRLNGVPSSKLSELEIEIRDVTANSTMAAAVKADKLAALNAARVTVSDCLKALGVPTHTQVARYALTQALSK